MRIGYNITYFIAALLTKTGKGCNFAQKKRRASSVGERPYNCRRSVDLSLAHFYVCTLLKVV